MPIEIETNIAEAIALEGAGVRRTSPAVKLVAERVDRCLEINQGGVMFCARWLLADETPIATRIVELIPFRHARIQCRRRRKAN